MDEQDEHLDELEEKLQEASENRRKEIRKVLKRLVTFEAQISMSLEVVEEGPAKTDDISYTFLLKITNVFVANFPAATCSLRSMN